MVVLTGKAAEEARRIEEEAKKIGVIDKEIELDEDDLLTIWMIQFMLKRDRRFLDLTKLYLKLFYMASTTDDSNFVEAFAGALETTFSKMYKFLKVLKAVV